MADIKSSIEIAMERTKNLRLSSEEKERILQEEDRIRAVGVANRYGEGDLSLQMLERELSREPGETRNLFVGYLREALIQGIQITQDNQRILEAITVLKEGKVDREAVTEIANLEREYREELKEALSTVESILREELKGSGIHGNAVLPNIKESYEWQEREKRIRDAYDRQLELLKTRI